MTNKNNIKITTAQEKLDKIDAYLGNNSKSKLSIFSNNCKKFFRKNTRWVVSGAVALSAMAIFITGCAIKRKNETNTDESTNNIYKPTTSEITQTSLDELGVEEQITQADTTKKYGNTTGKVNKSTIVKDSNGTIWADQESADNAKNVGKVTYDTKDDTLEVIKDEDGKDKVVEKDEKIQVTDKDGNVKTETVDSNTKYAPDGTPIPDGYAWDSARNEIVPENEVGKFVYDKDGDLVSVEDANKSEKTETTTTTTIVDNNTSKEEAAPATDSYGGITNANGTYSIFGLTFESKADFEQWVAQGYEGYAENEADGIMRAVTLNIEEYQNSK